MNHAMAAMLLSGLVFPGMGQFVLKHYLRGVALMTAALVCLTVALVKVVKISSATFHQLAMEIGVMDLDTLTSTASRVCTPTDSLVLRAGIFLLVLFWAVSIIDAYRIGRRMDMANRDVG